MECIRGPILKPARQSLGVTQFKASPKAWITVSLVRAATCRRYVFALENISSMGVSSGLYGGNGSTRAHAACTAAMTALFLGGFKLSQTTTSSGCRTGTNTFSTYV